MLRNQLALVSLALLAVASPAFAQKKGKDKPVAPLEGTSKEFADLGLTITIPKTFTDLAEGKQKNKQLKQLWTAKFESVELEIMLFALPLKEFEFTEPEDVMDLLLENVRDPKEGDPSFSFEKQQLVVGNFGVLPYASLAWGALHDEQGTKTVATQFYLGGMLENDGYTLEIRAKPEPGPEGVKAIVDFLERGVSFKGKVRDPKWTAAEVKERWEKDAPEKLAKKKLENLIRTEHYIIFTDSSGGKAFAKQMEENYQAIKKVYPFEEVAGRRLMPVFLFQLPEEYFEYFAKQSGVSLEEARKSKGVASGDWYATYYDSPGDPVHIHEGTHQIFKNRLRLGGGGSWFQEGVANYMSEIRNDLNDAARTVKKGKHTPLVEFVKIKSLLFSSKTDVKNGDDAAGHYELAALLIEFLRESKFGKDKFQDFIHSVGLAARNNVKAIERCVQSVYGTDLAGLEKEWVEYCKKR